MELCDWMNQRGQFWHKDIIEDLKKRVKTCNNSNLTDQKSRGCKKCRHCRPENTEDIKENVDLILFIPWQ